MTLDALGNSIRTIRKHNWLYFFISEFFSSWALESTTQFVAQTKLTPDNVLLNKTFDSLQAPSVARLPPSKLLFASWIFVCSFYRVGTAKWGTENCFCLSYSVILLKRKRMTHSGVNSVFTPDVQGTVASAVMLCFLRADRHLRAYSKVGTMMPLLQCVGLTMRHLLNSITCSSHFGTSFQWQNFHLAIATADLPQSLARPLERHLCLVRPALLGIANQMYDQIAKITLVDSFCQ